MPGAYTPWIALHEAALPGHDDTAHLVVVTIRQRKHEFYNFFAVQLSPAPMITGQTYQITFNNALDANWSRLDFKIRIASLAHPGGGHEGRKVRRQ